MPNLTDTLIRAAKPPERGQTTITDSTLPNFGLRLSQGGSKTFVVMLGNGRRKTIGRYPIISLADARKEARRILAEKTLGKIHHARTPFAQAVESFLDDARSRTRPRTLKDYQRLLKHFPFGRTSLSDITPGDILTHLRPLPPSEKHHAFTAGRIFFRWCIHQHLIERSPMDNIDVPKTSRPRDRVLSPDELRSLLEGLRFDFSPFKRLVLLLLYTGQRRGEIAALEWSWIDDSNRLITFPADITKNKRLHTIPYGEHTRHILNTTPVVEGCPYVFPAARKRSDSTTVLNGFGKPKRQLDKQLADKLGLWQLHDLRRTYSSTMASLGVAQIVVEKLLNHVSQGTQSPIAATYNRYSYMSEMRDAVAKYEDYLSTLPRS